MLLTVTITMLVVSIVMSGQWTSGSGHCSILSVAVVNLAVLVIDVAVTVVTSQ